MREADILNYERLISAADMTAPEVFGLAGGTAVVFSARSPDKPTVNEDSAALIQLSEQCLVLVVADGMGGLPAGERASHLAVKELCQSLSAVSADGADLRDCILNGLENANRTVSALAVGAATTLAVVTIQGRTARPYHVGDSMILIVGQRGKQKLQTVSHSPVGYAVEAGFLDSTEAMHHAERHVVSNMIGTPDMRIEIGSPIELATHDTLLVASDGLFDNLHIEEIVARIRTGTLENVARRLADDCRQRMREPTPGQPSKPDDLTFIAFRSRPGGPSA